jgi:tetratricopeptide (TPR) repeat protein
MEGGVSLKICKPCMGVKYCNAICQRKHWPTHKKDCKRRVAELRDEALFKDPPPKEDCPICFLPMPNKLICCASLPPATLSSVPIYDFAVANEELANKQMETYCPCCGKSICRGCVHSFHMSENDKCPFCNYDHLKSSQEEKDEEIMKRVEANDPNAICVLAYQYDKGLGAFQQNRAKAMELYTRAAALDNRMGNCNLGNIYEEGGDLKKAKLHYEVAAMAGHEQARNNLGVLEAQSGNMERAFKHWTIAASAGHYKAMHFLSACSALHVTDPEKLQYVRESIDSTLEAYNDSCTEMRSEARDACIRDILET